MPLSPRGLLTTLMQEQPHYIENISVYPRAQLVGYDGEYHTPQEVRALRRCMAAIIDELTATGTIAEAHGTNTFHFTSSDKPHHVDYSGTEFSLQDIRRYLGHIDRVLELLDSTQPVS